MSHDLFPLGTGTTAKEITNRHVRIRHDTFSKASVDGRQQVYLQFVTGNEDY